MLHGAGYPENKYAFSEVREHFHSQGMNVSDNSLRRWAVGKNINGDAIAKVGEHKRDMGAAMQDLFWDLIEHVSGDKTIDELKGVQAFTAMAIVFDKLRLLEGKSTENIAHELSVSQRSERITALLDDARTRRTGQTSSDG